MRWGGRRAGGAEGAASREQGAGRGRQGGGEAQAAQPPGWCSAAAGRVVSPFPSSHSGLPTPEAGVLLPPWLEPGCLVPPGVVQLGVAGGSHDGRSSEGSGDWVWGSGRGGQMAHARALPSRSPCPNRFPLSGWVSVSKLRNCCLLRDLPPPPPSKAGFSTFVFWSRFCLRNCRCSPPQFPTRSVCMCE